MRTSPDCLPCFTRQATYAASLATVSPALQKKIVRKAAMIMAAFDLKLSPPENAVFLYRMIAELTGNGDIFAELKINSNQTALATLPALENIIDQSAEPLRTAALLAIAGNIIDYGSRHDFDLHQALDQCLGRVLAIDDLNEFRSDLLQARNILYLGDNCGELAFDRLLIKQWQPPVAENSERGENAGGGECVSLGQFKRATTFAVKEKPIINDALHADARTCGLDRFCRIISNGTACPGTPLANCSPEFRKAFGSADLIISKGQGNFETLSETAGPIYFFLMAKCGVVARHLAHCAKLPENSIKIGDLILMKKR